MRAIYYDGSVEGAGAAAKAARAAIPPEDGPVRLRDAHAWAQQPQQGIEKFDAVVIPAASAFDDLADLYAEAGAAVTRDDLALKAAEPTPAPAKKGKQ